MRRKNSTSPAAGSTDEGGLREAIFAFLALNEQPNRWTFFRPAAAGAAEPPGRLVPDLLLDIGGRLAYVAIRRQGAGPLPPARACALALARLRGAPCFVVRSLPEMERVLRMLGVSLRPPGRLALPRPSGARGS